MEPEEDEDEDEEGREALRGTAHSGRAPPQGVVPFAERREAATATPTQLPPSGRKSLSPWGSYQVMRVKKLVLVWSFGCWLACFSFESGAGAGSC